MRATETSCRRRQADALEDVRDRTVDDPPDERRARPGEHHARGPVAKQGPASSRERSAAITTIQIWTKSNSGPQTKSNNAGSAVNQLARADSKSPGSPIWEAVTASRTSDSVSRTTSVGRRNRSDVDGTAKRPSAEPAGSEIRHANRMVRRPFGVWRRPFGVWRRPFGVWRSVVEVDPPKLKAWHSVNGGSSG